MKNFWKTNPLKKNKPFDEKTFEKKTTSVYKKKPNPCEKKKTKKTNLMEKITKTHGKKQTPLENSEPLR